MDTLSKAKWKVKVGDPYRDTKWMEHARCLEVDPDIFYPNLHDKTMRSSRIQLTQNICNLCPVRKACEIYSKSMSLGCGIWGRKVYEASEVFEAEDEWNLDVDDG